MSGWGFAGSLVGAATDIGMGLFNAHHSAKEARAADKRAYQYWHAQQINGPKLLRQGYEDAGYNPMLALNGGSASMPSTHQGTSNVPSVSAGAAQMGKFLEDLAKDKAQAEVDNIEADTELKDAQKQEAKTRTLQSAAITELTNSQAERSDLAYGLDIANTLTGVAGTASSLYSAKSMSDVAKQNAATNARNASVNERKANTTQIEVRRNAKGQKVGEIQRSTRANGVPSVSSSANSAVPNASGMLGGSSKTVGSIAKEVAKELILGSGIGLIGAGVGAGMAPVRRREMHEHEKKRKDKSRKWYHNFDRFHFDY